jgi:DNA-binding MarR family transcriptional regulator
MNAAVDYRALAELRYQLRVFVSFSERAARELGIEPQQHQLLLAIKGLPLELRPTLGVLAARLQLRHHSVVELVDRLERAELATRTPSPTEKFS